jgi:hypothetical protein
MSTPPLDPLPAPVPVKKRRWYLAPLWWLAAIALLLEEWLWDRLKRLMAQVARLPLWAQMERGLGRLPPWAALIALVFPSLVILPAKLFALFLLHAGHVFWGICIAISAKLVGTALVARVFTVTKPALMRMPWFARLHDRIMAWLDAAKAWVRSLAAYQQVRATMHGWKLSIKATVQTGRTQLRQWWTKLTT